MASIAIGKGVDDDQAMMEADGNFIRRIGGMLYLIADVIEQILQFDTDLEPIDADVFVGLAEIACPLPGFTEHLLVQLANEGFVENFLALLARPGFTLHDVQLLPLVQLTLRGDMAGDQAGELVGIKRGSARRVVDIERHYLPRQSARRGPLSRLSAISRVCASTVSRDVDCASNAMVWLMAAMRLRANSLARASRVSDSDCLGTRAYWSSQPIASAARRSVAKLMVSSASDDSRRVTVEVVTPRRSAICVAVMPRLSLIALTQPEGGRGGRSALRQRFKATSSWRRFSSEKFDFILLHHDAI